VPHVHEELAVQEAIIRAIAKALLLRFPKLKPLLSEKDLVVLLTEAWVTVRSWAESHGKSAARAAVEFRRSVFAVMKRLARRQRDASPTEALSRPVSGGAVAYQATADQAVLAAHELARLRLEIAFEARRRLVEGEGDSHNDGPADTNDE